MVVAACLDYRAFMDTAYDGPVIRRKHGWMTGGAASAIERR